MTDVGGWRGSLGPGLRRDDDVMWTTHPRNLRGEALRVAGDVTCGTHRFWNRVNISHDSLTASAETSASGTGS